MPAEQRLLSPTCAPRHTKGFDITYLQADGWPKLCDNANGGGGGVPLNCWRTVSASPKAGLIRATSLKIEYLSLERAILNQLGSYIVEPVVRFSSRRPLQTSNCPGASL